MVGCDWIAKHGRVLRVSSKCNEIVGARKYPIVYWFHICFDYSIFRKRQGMKGKAATVPQDINKTEGEGQDPRLYFQQKAELDVEQRRHEMEAVEARYELEGDNEIREIPADEREMYGARQEL